MKVGSYPLEGGVEKLAETLTEQKVDCLWMSFLGRKDESPLANAALQWIDWKLQGVVSRFIVSGSYRGKGTTFVPTMRRLSVPYVALESNKTPDWEAFVRNCEGLRWEHVFFLCEDADSQAQLAKELKAIPVEDHPRRVTLVTLANQNAT